MSANHTAKLVEHVHGGTIDDEVKNAIEYCEDLLPQPEWMTPIGSAAATATPREVVAKLGTAGHYAPDAVKFGGTLGLLNCSDRVAPISDMDVGRMRWACEVLDETHKCSTVFGDIAVRGEFPSGETWDPAMLRRVERDAEIDVVLLSLYWHMPAAGQEHPLKNLCRDLIFCAQQTGKASTWT